ncbi:MAG: alkaline phosphatase, partial [Chlorobiales bacterium]|nr:alkaline phosphatase [Chlorobiales bacterium]
MQNTRKHRSFFQALMVGLIMSMLVVSISGCDDDDGPDAVNAPTATDKTPKYIFFFIGDGMASPQVNMTEAALADPNFRLVNGAITLGAMNLQHFPIAGMATTHAEDRYITGSAAAATALATGHKTSIGTISKNVAHTQDLKTMAEMAKEKGMKVGIVSSVSIDHATPACFYAHANSRGEYYNIASQMDESGFDYFGGG